jgi:hypothetical protein
MKEILRDVSVWVELVLEGATEPLGRWPWGPAVPVTGDILEHEGRELRVVEVRWSTADPSTVRLVVRAT